eukprot:jgi/Bigna1/130384/aug1.11_g5092
MLLLASTSGDNSRNVKFDNVKSDKDAKKGGEGSTDPRNKIALTLLRNANAGRRRLNLSGRSLDDGFLELIATTAAEAAPLSCPSLVVDQQGQNAPEDDPRPAPIAKRPSAATHAAGQRVVGGSSKRVGGGKRRGAPCNRQGYRYASVAAPRNGNHRVVIRHPITPWVEKQPKKPSIKKATNTELKIRGVGVDAKQTVSVLMRVEGIGVNHNHRKVYHHHHHHHNHIQAAAYNANSSSSEGTEGVVWNVQEEEVPPEDATDDDGDGEEDSGNGKCISRSTAAIAKRRPQKRGRGIGTTPASSVSSSSSPPSLPSSLLRASPLSRVKNLDLSANPFTGKGTLRSLPNPLRS